MIRNPNGYYDISIGIIKYSHTDETGLYWGTIVTGECKGEFDWFDEGNIIREVSKEELIQLGIIKELP